MREEQEIINRRIDQLSQCQDENQKVDSNL